jgi:predicted phosphodiesterase
LPVYDTLIIDTICFGDTYTNPTYAFLDTMPTAPGLIAWDTTLYTIIGGCDSIVRLELTVLPVYNTLITDTICFGDTYINQVYAFLDTTPTAPGLIAWDTTLYTVIGNCDSTVRLELTVLPVYDTLITDTICFGDTYTNPTYAFLDTTPTAPGLIAWDTTLYTVIGSCDSTVRLELTVLPVYDTLVTDTICLGDTYINPTYAFLDTTPTTPGLIAWDTTLYTVIGNCDSTVRLELTVLPVYDTLITDTICFGDTYTNPTYAFLDTTPTAPGLIAWDTTLYMVIGNCDSTVRLELTVLHVYDTLITDTICFGDTYINTNYAFLDTTPTMPGLIAWDTTLYTIIGGCDSIVRLELTVLPVYNTLVTDTICFGDTYINPVYAFLDTTPTATGLIALDTTLYTIIGGCDSTVRLELTVLPVYDTLVIDTICFGDTYINPAYAFLDTTPTMPGLIAWDTTLYTIIGGCDSTVRLELTVLPVYDTLVIDTICFGDAYINPVYAFLDTTPTAPGLIAWDTTLYTIIGGCDSTVRLELTVLPVYDRTVTASICLGDTYKDDDFDLTPAAPGLVKDSTELVTVIGGCDSIIRLELTVLATYDTLITDTICLGKPYDKYGFNEEPVQVGLMQYSKNLTGTNGCDSMVNLNLMVNPTYDIIINASVCEGDSYDANGFNISVSQPGFYTYTHSLKTTDCDCDSIVTLQLAVNPVYDEYVFARIYEDEFYRVGNYQYNTPGLHVSNLKTEEGCDSIVTLNLDVIYYPFITAFSPFNKDGINDYFMSGFRVQIFNRYGTPVYETRTQEEQDMGWDGKNSRGQNVEPGLYFYILYNSSGKPRLKSSVEVLKR